jgi:hypothetical protein
VTNLEKAILDEAHEMAEEYVRQLCTEDSTWQGTDEISIGLRNTARIAFETGWLRAIMKYVTGDEL